MGRRDRRWVKPEMFQDVARQQRSSPLRSSNAAVGTRQKIGARGFLAPAADALRRRTRQLVQDDHRDGLCQIVVVLVGDVFSKHQRCVGSADGLDERSRLGSAAVSPKCAGDSTVFRTVQLSRGCVQCLPVVQ